MNTVILGSTISDILKAFVVGGICGAVFAFFKLPIPAPPVIAGIVGIFGILVGALVVGQFVK